MLWPENMLGHITNQLPQLQKNISMASIKCIDRSKYYNSIFAYVVLISPFQILMIFECHGYKDHEIILLQLWELSSWKCNDSKCFIWEIETLQEIQN